MAPNVGKMLQPNSHLASKMLAIWQLESLKIVRIDTAVDIVDAAVADVIRNMRKSGTRTGRLTVLRRTARIL